MKKPIFVFCFCFLFQNFTFTQGRQGGNEGDPPPCISANAGVNRQINSGQSTVIGGNSPNANFFFSWYPTSGLNSNTIATPTASPSQSTTYYLTVSPKNNLIANGSFEQGNVLFSSDYSLGISGNNYGTYDISNSPSTIYSWWCPNTSTNGSNMLVADGSLNNNQRIWYQTVNILPSETYTFSGQFLRSSLPDNDANKTNLIIKINGVEIYNTILAGSNCNWETINATWNSNSNENSASIEIYANPQMIGVGQGNDLAIDNLSFTLGDCPMSTSKVNVCVSNTEKPVISPSGTTTLCRGYDSHYEFTLTSSPNISSKYQWLLFGQEIPGANSRFYFRDYVEGSPIPINPPTSSTPGSPTTYEFTVTNGCETSDPIYVIDQPLAFPLPEAEYLSVNNSNGQILNGVKLKFDRTVFFDPNHSFVTYSATAPNIATLISFTPSVFEATFQLPSNTAFPAMLGIEIKTLEFGCHENYLYDFTFSGNINESPVFNNRSFSGNNIKRDSNFQVKNFSDDNIKNSFSLKTYPNPVSSTLFFSSKNNIQKVDFFNAMGLLVKSVKSETNLTFVDVSNLARGIYYLHITSGKTISKKKIIIVR